MVMEGTVVVNAHEDTGERWPWLTIKLLSKVLADTDVVTP